MTPRNELLNRQMRDEACARITRAALEVFAEYGYFGTTMEQIMKASGLSKGLVYHYFPSKEKVFFHLIDTALEISAAAWQPALDHPGTAWQKIQKLSVQLVNVSFTEESLLYSRLILQSITHGKGIPGLGQYIFEHAPHFQSLPMLIAEAQQAGDLPPGDPGVLTSKYFALFHGLTVILSQYSGLRESISPEWFNSLLKSPISASGH